MLVFKDKLEPTQTCSLQQFYYHLNLLQRAAQRRAIVTATTASTIATTTSTITTATTTTTTTSTTQLQLNQFIVLWDFQN